MKRQIILDELQVGLLVDITHQYRRGVVSGDITGYGQTKERELETVDATLDALRGEKVTQR